MLGFSAFKRKPRQFTYTPRYYDPQKEEREARQRLNGIIENEDEKYVPGSYIRSQRARRMLGIKQQTKTEKNKIVFIRFIIAIVLLLLTAYFIVSFDGLEKLIEMKR